MPSFENPFSFPRPAPESPHTSSTAPEQVPGTPEDPNEVVLVDGAIRGLNTSRLTLAEFFEAPSFKECFFETASGNIYGIFKQNMDLILADGRSNADQGSVHTGSLLSDASVLEVGQPFRFGSGNTSRVTQIVIVTDAAFVLGVPTPADSDAIAAAETGGRRSDIRQRFRKMVSRGD